MKCCGPVVPIVGGQAEGGGGASQAELDEGEVLYEINYAEQADLTIVNGANVIGDVTYTGAVIGAATRTGLEQLNAQGIVWLAPTSGASNAMTDATQTAAHMYATLGTYLTAQGTRDRWRPWYRLAFDVYLSDSNFENNVDAFYVFLWGVTATPLGANARFRSAGLGNNSANRGARVVQAATISTGIQQATQNIISLDTGSFSYGGAHYGTWDATDLWNTGSWEQGAAMTLDPSGANEPMMRLDTRVGFAFVNGAVDASPTTSVTIERFRIRRIF